MGWSSYHSSWLTPASSLARREDEQIGSAAEAQVRTESVSAAYFPVTSPTHTPTLAQREAILVSQTFHTQA